MTSGQGIVGGEGDEALASKGTVDVVNQNLPWQLQLVNLVTSTRSHSSEHC